MAEYSVGDIVLHESQGRGTVVCLEGGMMTLRLESGERLRCQASCAPIITILEQGRTELRDRAKADLFEYIIEQNKAIIEKLDRIERILGEQAQKPAEASEHHG
ncbi:MAG: hypothetical protein IJO87_08855 [Eggerthellaceae bacterium]|nr:hypothetical protein [Eggerthellaceae bacterium]